MKHTHAELVAILRDLVMGDGLTAVMEGLSEVLLDARDTAYRDYEDHNLRSSLELAKAWQQDAEVLQVARLAIGAPTRKSIQIPSKSA